MSTGLYEMIIKTEAETIFIPRFLCGKGEERIIPCDFKNADTSRVLKFRQSWKNVAHFH